MPRINRSPYTEAQLLEGFRRGDREILNYVFVHYRPAIQLLIVRLGGNPDDAKDIFQDALIELMEITNDPDFIPRCRLKTLIYAICKNIWMNRWRRKQKDTRFSLPEHDEPSEPLFAKNFDLHLYERLFWRVFNTLSKTCREILILHWREYSNKIIANILNISASYIRKRKSMCTKELIEKVKTHKEYMHLMKGEPVNNANTAGNE